MTKELDIYDIWQYIRSLLPDELVCDINQYLCIDVVKINPETQEIDDNPLLNTKIEVWLEFGLPILVDKETWSTIYEPIPHIPIPNKILKGWRKGKYIEVPSHDINLDCGGNTFEEAFLNLYKLLKEKYKV